MRYFRNHINEEIILSSSSWDHIQSAHPDISQDLISECLGTPSEIRQSTKNPKSELYYLIRTAKRFTCVVVKKCPDGNFISTAMTTSKPKFGIVIYRKS